MAAKEVKTDFVWKVQCQECKAHLSDRGLKSVPLADDFITKHSGETGHMQFGMDVFSYSISIVVIDAGET